MEILTYPIGLVIGVLPVVANLEGVAPARLLLDGTPACTLTAEVPRCEVDVGHNLQVHLLELVRTDPGGAVVERATRWVNRPGTEAEVYLGGSCDESTLTCTVTVGWGHPEKQDPVRMVATVDGAPAFQEVGHAFTFRTTPDAGRVVTVDVTFPDGRRASQTAALAGGFAGAVGANVHPMLVLPGQEEFGPRAGDRRVRSVEDAPSEVAFVVEPGALQKAIQPRTTTESDLFGFAIEREEPRHTVMRSALQGLFRVFAVVPDGRLGRIELTHRDWLAPLGYGDTVLGQGAMRLADAVAAAGYAIGVGAHTRAVVLVRNGKHRDTSSFSAAQVRGYLDDIGVPLVVWRVGPQAADGWPDGARVTPGSLPHTVQDLQAYLASQRIAWVEGEPRYAAQRRDLVP